MFVVQMHMFLIPLLISSSVCVMYEGRQQTPEEGEGGLTNSLGQDLKIEEIHCSGYLLGPIRQESSSMISHRQTQCVLVLKASCGPTGCQCQERFLWCLMQVSTGT